MYWLLASAVVPGGAEDGGDEAGGGGDRGLPPDTTARTDRQLGARADTLTACGCPK